MFIRNATQEVTVQLTTVQTNAEWNDEAQELVIWDKVVHNGKMYEIPSYTADVEYVQVSGTPYEPVAQLEPGMRLKVTGLVAQGLMQTTAYDKVEFVPSTLTVATARTEERSDWDATEPEASLTSLGLEEFTPERNLLHGYTLITTAADKVVECWYCPNGKCEYSLAEFAVKCPQAYDEERILRAFCYAMLEHYQEHRDANDLPYIWSDFAAQIVKRPDGKIAAHKPARSVRWQIKGKLLGSPITYPSADDASAPMCKGCDMVTGLISVLVEDTIVHACAHCAVKLYD